MQNYTTWNAIVDMAIIYSIVVIISMLVAAVIRGIVIVLSRQASHLEAQVQVKPATAAQLAFMGVPQEHIAVIAAAVASMMGAHRIVRIETASHSYGWTSEVRATHHTSHTPRAR